MKQEGSKSQEMNLYRDKFTKANINFGTSPGKDVMKTVSQTVSKDTGVSSAQDLFSAKDRSAFAA